MEAQKAVLRCDDLRKRFGQIEAVRAVSLKIVAGGHTAAWAERRRQDDDDLDRVRAAGAPRRHAVISMGLIDDAEHRAALGDRRRAQDPATDQGLDRRGEPAFLAVLDGLSSADTTRRTDEAPDVIGLRERADEPTEGNTGGT